MRHYVCAGAWWDSACVTPSFADVSDYCYHLAQLAELVADNDIDPGTAQTVRTIAVRVGNMSAMRAWQDQDVVRAPVDVIGCAKCAL